MKYYQVLISAENKMQADTILDSLLEKKLVTGGQFLEAPARFWWKGKIENMETYITITSFTIERHKENIIRDVTATTQEEFPMIQFISFEGNSALEEWIEGTVK